LQHSPLIEKYLTQLKLLTAATQLPVLDLACGRGRNGLYLVENKIPVTFADLRDDVLEQVKASLSSFPDQNQAQILGRYWQVDFEKVNTAPLKDKSFAAVMVFRYLHRPLFEQIKAAVKPGGLIIYETFTEQQAQFGRPKNPNFLLKPTELNELFNDWQILYSFEGVISSPSSSEAKQAIAQIVARKPN